MLPSREPVMHASCSRVTAKGGEGADRGRTLKERPSAKAVGKEAETELAVCTRVLKTLYLKVETI